MIRRRQRDREWGESIEQTDKKRIHDELVLRRSDRDGRLVRYSRAEQQHPRLRMRNPSHTGDTESIPQEEREEL